MNLSPSASPTKSRTRRRAARIAATALVAAGLVVAAPLAASAHVTATPDTATAGGYGTLTFAFSHGCDDSPTTALDIEIPDGVSSVSPTLTPGWSIDVERDAADGLVSRVVYTADEPVESGFRAALVLGIGYSDDAAGQTLAFPVTQVCVDGETAWTEIAEEGVDPHSLDAPAPLVTVAEAGAGGDHHGGDTAADDGAADDQTDASTDASASVLPIVLGGAGLALGAAALVVALLAFRRSRT